jgi:hypothetical protein
MYALYREARVIACTLLQVAVQARRVAAFNSTAELSLDPAILLFRASCSPDRLISKYPNAVRNGGDFAGGFSWRGLCGEEVNVNNPCCTTGLRY